IAMSADASEPIRIDDTRRQIAFLVDCRSLSGSSGSAALAFLEIAPEGGMLLLGSASRPMLLGIDCAHLPFWRPVCESKSPGTKLSRMWVESNSGIAVVVPAWRILAILNRELFVEQRQKDDARIAAETNGSAAFGVNDADKTESPCTKADSETTSKRVSRELSDEAKSET